ncbi:MAG: hypothetical protein ABIO05_07365 [Ferruginibacter sp.]
MNLIIILFLLVIVVLIIRKSNPNKSAILYILAGGLTLGILGLFLGILFAVIFDPGNNLSPIIGISFTGPLGFIVGLFTGYFYWRNKVKKGI